MNFEFYDKTELLLPTFVLLLVVTVYVYLNYSAQKQIYPKKRNGLEIERLIAKGPKLCIKDEILLRMLGSSLKEPSYCITNPTIEDNPIVFASGIQSS